MPIPGEPDHAEERRQPRPENLVPRLFEALELDVAADERVPRFDHRLALAHADDTPHLDGLGLSLRSDRLGLLVLDRIARRAVGLAADEDPVDGRGGLETRCGVHHVAGRHALALARTGSDDDERLTRVHADADLQVEPLVGRIQIVDRLADRKSGSDRAFRVVFVRNRSSEDGDHRIPDELLDGAAEPLELGAEARVVRAEPRAHVLRDPCAPPSRSSRRCRRRGP